MREPESLIIGTAQQSADDISFKITPAIGELIGAMPVELTDEQIHDEYLTHLEEKNL